MKVYESKDIRNVGVVGHGDSGKTTLTAGLLFTAGATNRLLRVDEGNTITDFDEEEIQRKITISTAIAVAEWKKTKINILDTPGYNIFINDTRGALVAADAAIVVVDGVAGVEVQTEKVWAFAERVQTPPRHRRQQAGSRPRRFSSAPSPASRKTSDAPPSPSTSPSAASASSKASSI